MATTPPAASRSTRTSRPWPSTPRLTSAGYGNRLAVERSAVLEVVAHPGRTVVLGAATPRPGGGRRGEPEGDRCRRPRARRTPEEAAPTPRGRPPSGRAARGRGRRRATGSRHRAARPRRPRRRRGADPTPALEGERGQRGRGQQAGAEQPAGHLLDALLGDGRRTRWRRRRAGARRRGAQRVGGAVIRWTPTASSGMTRFQPGWISRASSSLRPSGCSRSLLSS